ncbi:MAG: hypothetical protein U9R48_11210 [Chloroflexota bacterium]|nr:hypothetical protein [Chloroflexota bacterium]
MDFDAVVKAVVSAVVAFTVPKALNQFWPVEEEVESLPWLKWCMASAVGGLLGGSINLAVGVMGAGVGNWAILGVSLGLFQWLALRGYRNVGTWFILASTLGWMLFNLGGRIVSGVAVGIMQYLSLTQWRGAVWWIPANIIAWPVAGRLGTRLGMSMGLDPGLSWLVAAVLTALVGSIILLFPLSRLAKKE